MEGKLNKLVELNERIKNALNKVNYVLYNQTVVYNGVNLTTMEAIYSIVV